MATGLIDTAVLVDVLRKYQPAENWLAGQAQLGVTRIVYLELLDGVTDKTAQRKALNLLKHFEVVEMTTADFDWATRQLIQYRLSHGMDMMDCLIAAPSHRLGIPLYSRNLKHFTPLLGTLVQRPY